MYANYYVGIFKGLYYNGGNSKVEATGPERDKGNQVKILSGPATVTSTNHTLATEESGRGVGRMIWEPVNLPIACE